MYLTLARPSIAVVLGALVTVIAGCSGNDARITERSAQVHGTVMFDGRPLGTGTITFIPKRSEAEGGRPGLARIGSDGSYRVGNANPDRPAGLAPGPYAVVVLAMEPISLGSPIARLIVPERYTDDRTSHLYANITPGENTLDFHLETE
jgi:hypothetical protein